jgi:hypothetical protein
VQSAQRPRSTAALCIEDHEVFCPPRPAGGVGVQPSPVLTLAFSHNTRRAGRRGGGRAVLLPLPRAYQARGTSAVQSPEVSARAQGAIMDFSRC